MEKENRSDNAHLAAISNDVVQRYGSGVKEHFVAYSGIDNETGKQLKRSLTQIAKSKVNPEYRDSNIKQQAGFSAEVKEVARRRAEEAISGRAPTTVRTDDIPGHVNDPLFDITSSVDGHGNPIPGSSVQMKFVGASPSAAVDKMMTKDFQKYIDGDVKMVVPSDYYDGMKIELNNRISELEKQVDYLKKNGKYEAASVKQAQLEKCKTLNKNLQKSKVSNAEALEARNQPIKSTAKDIARLGNRAGLEQAKIGAAIGGGMSLVRNLIDVCQGKKSKEEAALAVVGDTATAAGVSYVTAFGGAVIKGAAQNSSKEMVRLAAKTNLPAYVATSAIELTKTIKDFCCGKIDGVECLDQLGERGYGMVNSALYAAIGQAAIPIPVVGALAGSMMGYFLSSASYNVLKDSLREAKLAREERIRIEREVEESILMIRKFRAELEQRIEQNLCQMRSLFENAFCAMQHALNTGDVDTYIHATNEITRSFGKKPLYENAAEFDQLMLSNEPLRF
ncbi:MAG: hypothetical protein MJ202_05800 [Lentisphaeria bacterium]|nr:hypothetical protein [Lentisphaeria bacterium]